MADVQILAAGSESIPYAYTVPNTQEVIPKAVSAIFDGTGAAASFLPVLEIVSDAGIVVAQSPATQVAAGGSAEVSWFPCVGLNTSSGGVLSPDWGTYFIDTATVNGGGESGAAWNFDLGTPLLDLSAPLAPTIIAAGVYYIAVWVQSTDGWNTPSPGGGRLSFGTPSWTAVQTGGIDHNGRLVDFQVSLTAQAQAGDLVGLAFENLDNVSHDMFSNQVLVQKIGGV